ncbi:MAG: hypothetical protein EOP09_01605 [Proteobacteria bacterium]|nr:MAG: hypothetical protein EOP09_01605 [Pseudomonadota bacterium]
MRTRTADEPAALTPIHVSRTFKSLEIEGFVTRNLREIKIIDWHWLAKVGDFDSAYLHIPDSQNTPSDRT